MSYCISKDLIKRLPQKDIDILSESNPYIVAELIAEASRVIDLYLSSRWTTPLSSAPEIVKDWAVDITIYLLAARAAIPIWQKTDDDHVENTVIVKRYNDAIKMLEKIRDGFAELPGLGSLSETKAIQVRAKPPRFNDVDRRW
jgi:phage gp36-like protein